MNRKRLFFTTFIVALLLMMAWPVQADSGVQTTLTADTDKLTVGDPVQLTLEVTHPAGYQVIIPKLEQNWGNFEIQSQSKTETTLNDDGTEITRQNLSVTLFEPGTFKTPDLPLTISTGTGEIFEESTASVSLTVESVLAKGDTTLTDIRPQASMNVPVAWPMIPATLAAIMAVAGGGWWLYRRRRGKDFFGTAIDNRPPYQVAYDELDRINGLHLPEKGRLKEHYTLVTDCLRTYLEAQFTVNAFDRTTTELKQALSHSSLSNEHSRLFINLFSDSDFVKFAKLVPELNEVYQFTEQARILVNFTRPQPALEQEETAQQPVEPNNFHKHVEAVR